MITWGPCNTPTVNDTSLSCGFFEVPLDYHDPAAGKARLAVIKANATGERLGSVLFNPGGPGGSGLEALSILKDTLLARTGGAYDIVSWDPRGVGLSTPGEVQCFENEEEYRAFFAGTIELTGIEETGNFTDLRDIEALLAQADSMQKKYAEVAEKCMRSPSGKYLRYLGTAATVRDIVSIADALEGPDVPLNYIGVSYGTLIGSWLLGMFPERVGRVILDGVLDPQIFATQDVSAQWASQIVSADTILKGIATGCALTGPSGCAAAHEGDSPLDVDARVQAQLLQAAYDVTKANASVPLTSGNVRVLLFPQLYGPGGWSDLMNELYSEIVQTIEEESKNTTTTKRSLLRTVRHNPPPFVRQSQAENDAPSYTYYAVSCGDSIDTHGSTLKDAFESIIETSQHVSHLFGSVWPTLASECPFWPVRAVERYQGPFNKTLANKVLIASNTYDPITPLAHAQALATLLGEDAGFVRLNGFGHSTVNNPSSCITDVSAAYMVNGTLPENDTVCEVDEDFEIFTGVTTADILANLPSSDV